MQFCSSSWRFSKVVYRMKQPLFLGWKAGYSWCISTNLLFVLGNAGLLEWVGFSALKMYVPKMVVGQQCFSHPTHQASSWLLDQGSTRSSFFAYQCIHPSGNSHLQITGLWWTINYVLKELETSLRGVYTCNIFITLGVCLLLYIYGFFFQMGKWQRALESVEWTWESLVSIPEGSPAP